LSRTPSDTTAYCVCAALLDAATAGNGRKRNARVVIVAIAREVDCLMKIRLGIKSIMAPDRSKTN